MKENSHYKNIGVVLLVVLSIAFLYSNKYLFWGAAVLGIVLFSFETLAKLFSKYWMAFGKFLGDINSKLILSIFFLLLLTPIALIKRLFQQTDKVNESAWEDAQKDVDFTKPW